MKITRKILALLLSVLMVFTMASSSFATAEELATEKTEIEEVEKLMNDEVSTISLFYGADVSPVDAGALVDTLKDKYPDLEIDCHQGDQPLYYYLISLE